MELITCFYITHREKNINQQTNNSAHMYPQRVHCCVTVTVHVLSGLGCDQRERWARCSPGSWIKSCCMRFVRSKSKTRSFISFPLFYLNMDGEYFSWAACWKWTVFRLSEESAQHRTFERRARNAGSSWASSFLDFLPHVKSEGFSCLISQSLPVIPAACLGALTHQFQESLGL